METINDSDMLNDFIAESLENIENAENALLILEQGGDTSKIHEVFRAVHSIKGAAGFFKLLNIENVAHLSESILGSIRDDPTAITREKISVILKSIDMLHLMLKSSDLGKSTDISEILKKLEYCSMNASVKNECSSTVLSDDVFVSVQMIQETLPLHSSGTLLYGVKIDTTVLGNDSIEKFRQNLDVTISGIGKIINQFGDINGKNSEDISLVIFIETVLEKDIFLSILNISSGYVILIDQLTKSLLRQNVTPVKERAGLNTTENQSKEPELSSHKDPSLQTIRISVAVLDELLELIGEVVLGRNQFLNRFNNEKSFKSLSQSITKLHQHVIQTRMQPIGVLFNKYKRTVRDLSTQLDKRIELYIEGEEIELDRTIIEAIADPLTHLVRNSIDHGIESPSERSNSNKSIIGNINLRAYHESGQILIEVEDDGKGLDGDYIKKKAVQKKIITQQEADALSERDAINLIFLPGFSTKDQATSISGRGVGMDVVKTNLEKIGCVLELSSQKNKGTLFSARIPLTQAIVNSSVISGLIIKIGPFTLSIPQLAVNEVIKLSPAEQIEKIDLVNGQEVFKLRDKIIPLVHLEDILGIKRTYIDPFSRVWKYDKRRTIVPDSTESAGNVEKRKSSVIFIVLHFKQNFFGILVDQIAGTEEIVVKKLPKLIKHRRVFAGATILGNGEVSFILDINGMVEKAGLNFGKKADTYFNHFLRARKELQEKQKCVIFTYASNEYFAVPINLLSEVDRFNKNEIRNIGSREFIQRHSESVPLLRLNKYIDVSPIDENLESLIVIIPARVQVPTGIIASGIISTIDITEDINTKEASENGVMGTFFLDDKLITIIDIFTLLQKSDPLKYKAEIDDGIEKCRILFAEDQLFFRQLVCQYFRSHGIKNITTAKNGEEALKMLIESPDKYDVIVSDIEMPVMNGYELISNIKSDPRFSEIPVMALTSLSSEENIRKGLDIGFDAYEIKLDKEKVVLRLNELYQARKKLHVG